jgi:selenophosphate synthase
MNMAKKLMVGLENLNDGVILEICNHQLLTSRINQLKIPQDDISKKFANHGHIGNTLSFKHPAVTMDADALVWSLRELCCPQDFDGEVVS